MKWPMVKLADVCQVNPRLPKEYDETQDVSFLAMASVSEDGILLNQETRVLSETKKGFTYFERADVIVAKITPCFENGKAAYLDSLQTQVGFGSTEFHVLRPDIKQLDGKYLFYLIWNQKFRFIAERSMSGSAGQKRVPASFLQNFEVPLPPLKEQKRITAILDKADAIRQKRQQAIALADDFLRSVFLDMFGDPVTNPKEWDIYPLKNGITNITAGWSANGENHSCGDDEIGVLKISAVTSGIFKPNENKVVSSSNIPSNKKLVFPRKGDLLFSRANTRELVGATCIVDSDYDNVFLPDKLWVINLNSNELLPEYVHMLIQHPKFKECLTSQATGSSGSMLNISKAKFEGTLAPYPSLDVQHRFKDIFWKVMTCNALTNDSKINFDNQFNALSQKAFSGQL